MCAPLYLSLFLFLLLTACNKVTGDWSLTGGDGEAQPDNREFRVEGKHDEACIAMLNNFYADGAVS